MKQYLMAQLGLKLHQLLPILILLKSLTNNHRGMDYQDIRK
jgi:hypothetical protein